MKLYPYHVYHFVIGGYVCVDCGTQCLDMQQALQESDEDSEGDVPKQRHYLRTEKAMKVVSQRVVDIARIQKYDDY